MAAKIFHLVLIACLLLLSLTNLWEKQISSMARAGDSSYFEECRMQATMEGQ
jgi:hypothetical protein